MTEKEIATFDEIRKGEDDLRGDKVMEVLQNFVHEEDSEDFEARDVQHHIGDGIKPDYESMQLDLSQIKRIKMK